MMLTLEGLQVLGVSAEGAPAGGQRHRHLRPVQQPPQPQALYMEIMVIMDIVCTIYSIGLVQYFCCQSVEEGD